MGGSGGGRFFSGKVDPDDLARKVREAEEQADRNKFETEASEFLASELAIFNDRDIASTQKLFDAVKKDIESEVEGTVDLLFGGSVSKHTYVDGLSDIDALVLIDKTDLKGKSPKELQRLLASNLQARYRKNAVQVGELAVTLNYKGQSIQLLPALREGNKFKIANYGGKGWSLINPAGFAKALTKANNSMDGKLVPCIKLAKAIVSSLPEKRRLTGYHIESLAIKNFKGYKGDKTTKAMLQHFFQTAPTHVKTPIKDSSGQSVHVDQYLGRSNSLERKIVSDALGRIGRKIRNANGAQLLQRWKELFE
ncbi:CBASS oligonucleotide cyclase [Planctomycetota bacterium]